MKTKLKQNLFLVTALIVASGPAFAQTYTVLKSFGILTNVTGWNPRAPLVQDPDGTLYGTTSSGEGSLTGPPFKEGSVAGTVFKIKSDGTGFTVLKWFTNSVEGSSPYGGLVLSGSTLYGTTRDGGSAGFGTVFKVNTDGSGYAVLKEFAGSDGANPSAALTFSGSTLYGTTTGGGDSGYGTVFQVNTDGSGYNVLISFAVTNGAVPFAALTLSGSTLYGTTREGGSSNSGTVFKVNTDGSDHTLLKNFPSVAYDPTNGTATNSDGAMPYAALALSGSTLYGTTRDGGSSGSGTVFQVNTDGISFSVLMNFSTLILIANTSTDTNSDGANPYGALVLSGSALFGTTSGGGSSGNGTVFHMNTDGSGYKVLKSFSGLPSDGFEPYAGLTLSGNTLYGTTRGGGSAYYGTLFQVNMDGSGYAVLQSFGFSDSANPIAPLTLSGSTLYGATGNGGSSYGGAVFKMNTDGSGYTVLKSFSSLPGDGLTPNALTLSGSTLYGTTIGGGDLGNGTVFRVNTDGSGYTNLKNFPLTAFNPAVGTATNSDGEYPGGVTLAGSTLYGATAYGGSSGDGTVFKVNTDGSEFTVLKTFTGSDGARSYGGLTLSGGTLYGTTYLGGSSGDGTVFKVNTDGSSYRVLKYFSGPPSDDGTHPIAGLTLSGSTLYGTTAYGGSSGNGTVFKVNTDGSDYRVLKSFSGPPSDGGYPVAGLTLSGSTLYGATYNGTLFQVNTDGSGYAVLKRFTGSDGLLPNAALTLSGSTLYGTTAYGGSLNEGVVFALTLAPSLSVNLTTTDTVAVSWPSLWTGFILQENTILSMANWSNVTATIQDDGTTKTLIVNPPAGNRFYRLIQP